MTDETATPAAPEPPAAPPAPALTPPEPASPHRALSSADARPRRPDYRGDELDPERGPGLGCFWFQAIVLGFFIVLIPIGVNLAWPYELLAILLFIVIGLLLLTGQTVIFLLRLVAADRRAQGRRRPLASPTKTVGELEDEHLVAHAVGGARPVAAAVAAASPPAGAERPDAVAAPSEPVEPAAGANEPEADGVSVASEAMIRDEGVLGAPAEEADSNEADVEPVADSDVTDADEATRAPAPTTGGAAANLGDPAGGGEGQMAARTHESLPDGQRDGRAAAPAATPPADVAAPADAGEPPEEPTPGVRQ